MAIYFEKKKISMKKIICLNSNIVIDYFYIEENVWKRVVDTRIVDTVIYSVGVKSVLQCLIHCHSLVNCTSINYDISRKYCDLNYGTIESVFNIESNTDFEFWQRM